MTGSDRDTPLMFAEDDLLPLSALQHLLFCERQCALIHLEGLWAENRLTVEGRHLHRRVDEGPDEQRHGLRIVRGLALRSLRLGLVGKADDSDRVQLCAQALCLEEMLGESVEAGALYYRAIRRRADVAFDAMLRQRTAAAAARLHQLIGSGVTPRTVREPKCDNCSLLHLCLPNAQRPTLSAARFMNAALAASLDG